MPEANHTLGACYGLDPNVWQYVCTLPDGHHSHRPRQYYARAYDVNLKRVCDIPVTIDPSAPRREINGEAYYQVTAIAAHQLYFFCHSLRKLSDLKPV